MQRLQATYECLASNVSEARHAVEQALGGWGMDSLVWTAALLVSELAANALLHARTAFTVTLVPLGDGGARLEVRDGSPRLPRTRNYGQDATTGRGLHLLEDLSRRWGVDRSPDGKTVWAELDPQGTGLSARDHDSDDDLESLLLAFPDLEDGQGRPTTTSAA